MLDTVPDLLREGDKKYLMHQLLRGMAYMHDRWFLHRDLKARWFWWWGGWWGCFVGMHDTDVQHPHHVTPTPNPLTPTPH